MEMVKQTPRGGKEAFQLNFKFFDGEAWKIFHLAATNIILHYRIHGILSTEISNLGGVSKFAFSIEKNENIAFQ